MIYLDNAATSYHRPLCVSRAVTGALRSANPGRSGHGPALEAEALLLKARSALAAFFGSSDPFEYVFTGNCTEALNLALRGLLKPGDRVVASVFEHNSVLRTLYALGCDVVFIAPRKGFAVDPADYAAALPGAKLAVLTHVSNVTGARQPIEQTAAVCAEAGVPLLLDGAQAAGCVPIAPKTLPGQVLYAFPGHKGLLGPTGTGALFLPQSFELRPLMTGGTGSRSSEPEQPPERPDRYESGTANVAGLAGLGAALQWLMPRRARLTERERCLTGLLFDGLSRLPGLKLRSPENAVNIVTFTLRDADPAETADELWRLFAIAARAGLHCAPLTHRFLGTERGGAVRLSIGAFTTSAEITACVDAVRYCSLHV
ncbi:MAG: aminotransferase class V-fold PLP-dependent enzyme [Eubacteriales bacterium]|nr:aminotransferase class V-fold PLP-dependent enzyme [Eubacteriales bacterium]